MSKYIIHKAVDLHKIADKNRPTEDDLASSKYVWQPKIDGCNLVAIVSDTKVELLSRTGEPVLSADNLKKALSKLPLGVYLGEYVIPYLTFPVISGHFRNQKEQIDAQMVIFDSLTLSEWSAGKCLGSYHERLGRIPALPLGPLSVIYSGTRTKAQNWMESHPAYNYDGLIARSVYGTWHKGSSGVSGEIIKFKKNLTLDLEVKGIEVTKGTKTNRNVYTLVVSHQGKDLVVGSGVPHLKSQLPKVGDIVEIEALGTTTGGMLREPRFKGIRTDKLEPDT